MSKFTQEFHRCNPANWHFGCYFCRADKRLWVRRHLGWTLNWARPMAVPTLILLFLAVIAVVELLNVILPK